MKRTKQRTFGSRERELDNVLGTRRAASPEKTWEEHMASRPEGQFVEYSLKERFASGAFLSHPTFGKGVVVSVGPAVIEVLFADGKKRLGHNKN